MGAGWGWYGGRAVCVLVRFVQWDRREGSALRAPVAVAIAVVAVATWPGLVMTRWSLAYVLL